MANRKTPTQSKNSDKAGTDVAQSPSALIDARIAELGDWRGRTLARMRALIHQACPDVEETWKWRGVPVFEKDGILCTGETYKEVVKLTFAKGAKLPDPKHLFNASLDGNQRRAIDIREGVTVDAGAFKALIKWAVAANGGKARTAKSAAGAKTPVKLLSGGNPQIAKGHGDAPVQAYIAAMPGWKREVGRRLDRLIVETVPGVKKAVKWNSPFYGVEEGSWFLGLHCFTKYVKVAFFRGASLRPPPPGESKQKDVRYLDIREDDALDEAQLADWVLQASALPGVRM